MKWGFAYVVGHNLDLNLDLTPVSYFPLYPDGILSHRGDFQTKKARMILDPS